MASAAAISHKRLPVDLGRAVKLLRKAGSGGGRGFALMATLLLLMLIMVIALGLLSLSASSLRSSGTALARSQAQANARMALSLAIGQLQARTGPDQRITAPADFLAPAAPESIPNRRWTGVWRADEGEPTGAGAAREDQFLEWLVTTTGAPAALNLANEDLSSGPDGGSVLIRKKASADDVDVWVPLTSTPEEGRLGWWTEDESAKARANLPLADPTTLGEKLVVRHAAPRPAPEGVKPEIEGFEPTEELTIALATPGQFAFAATKWPDGSDKDFTSYSRSLMTDVKHGGFKQDLNTLFELPESTVMGLGDFGTWASPGSCLNSIKSYLYGTPGIPMGARWNMLYEYYNLYKKITFNGSEASITVPAPIANPGTAGDRAGGFRYPRLTNMSYVISYDTVLGVNPDPGLALYRYNLRLHVSVFTTLWNPFDTRIVFPSNVAPRLDARNRAPFRLQVNVSGAPVLSQTFANLVGPGEFYFFGNEFHAPGSGSDRFSIGPGETISFCYDTTSTSGANKFVRFSPDLPFFMPRKTITTNVWGRSGDPVVLLLTPHEHITNPGSNDNFSHFVQMTARGNSGISETRGVPKALSGARFIGVLDSATSGSYTFNQIRQMVAANDGYPMPLMGFRMSMKTATDSESGGDFVPWMLYSAPESLHATTFGSPFEPLSAKYEFSSVAFAPSPQQNEFVQRNGSYGLIGSGNLLASGQSHFMATSLPKVPVTSLAQLRHAGTGTGGNLVNVNLWNEGGRSNWSYMGSVNEFHTVAPFTSNAIGNSYGHPSIPSDRDTYRTPPDIQGGAYDMDDHSYKANAALWDKFFFSSLAPRDGDRFGSNKTMVQTWTEFLEGSGKLLNPRFSPDLHGGDISGIQAKVFSGSSDSSLQPDAFRKIAAHLILEGGFNVNSTSVDAWRAVLSSSLGQRLTRLTKGSTASSEIESEGVIFSRTDAVLSGSADASGSDVETHYTGYRELDEEAIKRLAEEMVKQVRLRGPFLNLGQFVNRKLSSDSELALAGAMQAAIDAADLNKEIRDAGMSTPPGPGGATMAFPEAAELGSAAGNPGWLMQADILDPIGPSLVARGDTFRIRAYGDARSPDGQILARARCEAVVQRITEFVDAREAPDAANAPSLPLNRTFGRRYQITQFRWLSPLEN